MKMSEVAARGYQKEGIFSQKGRKFQKKKERKKGIFQIQCCTSKIEPYQIQTEQS